jgi:hypothetical protein
MGCLLGLDHRQPGFVCFPPIHPRTSSSDIIRLHIRSQSSSDRNDTSWLECDGTRLNEILIETLLRYNSPDNAKFLPITPAF